MDRDSYILEQIKTRSLQDIGDELGITRQRVQQIAKRNGVGLRGDISRRDAYYDKKFPRRLEPPKPPWRKPRSRWWYALDALAEEINADGYRAVLDRYKINNVMLTDYFVEAGWSFIYGYRNRLTLKKLQKQILPKVHRERGWYTQPRELSHLAREINQFGYRLACAKNGINSATVRKALEENGYIFERNGKRIKVRKGRK